MYEGKRGLVLGVANKRSIAWAIAKRLADGGAELAHNKYGASLKQACWTAGPYDMVTIFEAPDEETLGAQLLEICSLGNIKMTRFVATTARRCQASSRSSAEPFSTSRGHLVQDVR